MTRQELLNSLQIASPCTADWNNMVGTETKRYCGDCKLNVYNISAMTEREAADLVTAREGRLCIRMFRRSDGTVITQDCPKGLRKIRRAVAKRMLALAALLGLSSVTSCGPDETRRLQTMGVKHTMGKPAKSAVAQPVEKMGDVAPNEMGEMVAPTEVKGRVANVPTPKK